MCSSNWSSIHIYAVGIHECHHESVQFHEELGRLLPSDIPHRECLIHKAAQHLHLIAAANEYMNLTRITDAREAAIKHVYDCVAPWQYFRGAKRVLDAGTGAGFPGIPLSLVLPQTRFTLAESIQKKARFVESAVDTLDLANVHVTMQRAEERALARNPEIITARALAPLTRIVELFRQPLKRGARLLLYKGPDVEHELAEANSRGISAQVLCRYELPEACGSRTLIEVTTSRGAKSASAPQMYNRR
jgi:16S rRNA (guanine527-N7)-methyltransferase